MQDRSSSRPSPVFREAGTASEAPDHTSDSNPDSLPAENPLSEREMEVARLLVTGATNSEIARELVISPHTVKVHLRNVFEKLQVSSRTEASMVLLQRGWLVMPGMSPGIMEQASAETVPAEPVIPEPEPLAAPTPRLAPWQRIYLVVALALCLVALFTPFVWSRSQTRIALLTDVGQTAIGKPSIEIQPRWEARAPLNQARSRMAVALEEQFIYLLGGEGSSGRALQAVDVYDLQTNQWQALPALPHPLTNSAAATLDGHIYLAGGTTPAGSSAPPGDTTAGNTTPGFAISQELLAYNPATQQWAQMASLPVPLAGAKLLADEETLYLLGGWDGEALRDEVWIWRRSETAQPQAAEWDLVTQLPTPAAFFGAALINESLYVAGGYDGQNELAGFAAYHLSTGEWQQLPGLSIPRSGLALVYDGVALSALGGGWTRTISGHERYDPVTNQWTSFSSPIPGEWRHLGAVSRDGFIHVLGGWSGDYLDTHLQYQSSFRALLPVITSD